jgi:eukaryotic-like serine/threonine-protein kinase
MSDPEDTFVQFMYLPTLRGLFALNTHDPAAAIQPLQVASRYDVHTTGVGFIGRFGPLYPIYVRGLAYLAARQPAEAAGEFQRILDHRSIVLVEPIWTRWRACSWHGRSRSLGRHGEGEACLPAIC